LTRVVAREFAMEDYRNNGFQLGEWQAHPSRNLLAGSRGEVRLEPKAMQVLEVLVSNPGRVFTRDELNDAVWDGRAISDEPLTHCIATLRQALGDSPKDPRYIQTIPKRGYRLICDVNRRPESTDGEETDRFRAWSAVRDRHKLVVGALVLVLVPIFMFASHFFTSSTPPEPVIEGAVIVERPPRSIAVMPFEEIGVDSGGRYFSDGLSDEVLNSISQLPELQVAGRTSSFFFRDKDVPLREIADSLNVAYILEGSVRRNADDIRITVQLVHTADGSLIWSRAYDRAYTAENLFDIQQDIATTIAAHLRATLTDTDRQRLEKVPTYSLEAYTAYLKGREAIARATTASLLEAAKHFLRAIELDATFANAYASLAESYWLYESITFGRLPEGVTEDTAGSLITRALELDPEQGFVHAMHGKWLASQGEEGAGAAFERAIELSPNNPDIYLLYGDFIDDQERSLEMYRKGLRIDPKSSRLNNAAAWLLFDLSRPDEAVIHYQRAIESDPDSLRAYWGLGILNWYFTGRLDEAMRWLRLGYSKDPGDVNNIAMIGWTYLFLTDDVAAEQWFRHAIAVAPKNFFGKWGMIDVYHVRGWHEEEWKLLNELQDGAYLRRLSHLIYDRRYQDALEEAQREFPEFFDASRDARQEYRDLQGGEAERLLRRDVWISLILDGLGEKEAAKELRANMTDYVDSRIVSLSWDQSFHAQVYAVLGQRDQAIESLRKMVAGGSFGFWQMVMAEPALDTIRNDPGFQQILDDIASEMAGQLEHVRKMERAGELAMLPEAA